MNLLDTAFGRGRMLLRRAQRQGQRVQAGGEFGGQRGMHGARAGKAVHAAEGVADQQDGVVGLAARLGAGVAGMAGAVIGDIQPRGGEFAAERGVQSCGA